ncbi:MAG: TetR/AcrR family transcriptional regulator [Deltaproteobacteria bacterium]|nr:TetR/AcrR family transcriptional regulator [Deltaproteobacteria bacterium]
MARRALSRSPEAVLADPEIPDFRQERARRSYQALLEAAAELFANQGYDAVGTPEIAQKAGVSVGTFYRYFDDKHEVYLEIMRRSLVDAYRATIENLTPERFVGLARHETIFQTVGYLFENVLANPQLTRSFMEMSLRDPQVAELRRAVEVLATQRLADLIRLISDPKDVPDPEAFAYVLYGSAMQCAYGLAVHLVPTAIDRERARAALTAFIERALFPGR